MDSDLRQLTDDAPWYCTCMQELFFRCNRVDDTPEELKTEILNFDTTEIVGFHARSDFLDRNWEILKLSIWTQMPALILFVVGLVAYVLVLVPWKYLAVKTCDWCAISLCTHSRSIVTDRLLLLEVLHRAFTEASTAGFIQFPVRYHIATDKHRSIPDVPPIIR